MRVDSFPSTFLIGAAAFGLLSVFSSLAAADDLPADPAGERPGNRLEEHRTTLSVTFEGDDAAKYQIAAEPMLNYSDPARRYLAGSVWRIGTSGRPLGMITMELWPPAGDRKTTVHRELSSFVAGGIDLRASDESIWRPKASVLMFQTIKDAPAPAASDAGRLLQMKRLARSFTATETLKGDTSELRLLPRQVDRYQNPKDGIQDGAMFAFVYGTNPELFLLLESDGAKWQFALARSSWAEINVWQDGERVHRFEAITRAELDGAYTSSAFELGE